MVAMRPAVRSTLLAALLLCACALSSHNVVLAQPRTENSPAAGKILTEAVKDINAKQYTEALEKLHAVEALSDRTPYDDYVLNHMLGVVYVHTSRLPEAAQAFEATLESEFLKPEQIPERRRQLIALYWEMKLYDKVIEHGEKAIESGTTDDEVYSWMGHAHGLIGDHAKAARYFEDHVNRVIARNKEPKEDLLRHLWDACAKTEDMACSQRSLERLVRYHPKAQYWQALVNANYRELSAETDRILLHVYRLKAEVDAMNRPRDYEEFAVLALRAGSPGEAQKILEAGMQRNIFRDTLSLKRSQRLLDTAREQAASDKAELPKLEKEAAAAKSGEKDVSLGLAYLGYQEYNKAIAAIERGLKKSSVSNRAEARLLLGIAQLGAGRKDAAYKTFESVKGDPKLERLASLWSLHAQA
jgi:hypothetical protein